MFHVRNASRGNRGCPVANALMAPTTPFGIRSVVKLRAHRPSEKVDLGMQCLRKPSSPWQGKPQGNPPFSFKTTKRHGHKVALGSFAFPTVYALLPSFRNPVNIRCHEDVPQVQAKCPCCQEPSSRPLRVHPCMAPTITHPWVCAPVLLRTREGVYIYIYNMNRCTGAHGWVVYGQLLGSQHC